MGKACNKHEENNICISLSEKSAGNSKAIFDQPHR